MAQNRTIVGIDVAKDKVDVALRAGAEGSFSNTPSGRRQLVKWVKQHQVDKAVMEASGGYERIWARLLQDAGLEVWIVVPSGCAASLNRPASWPRPTESMPA